MKPVWRRRWLLLLAAVTVIAWLPALSVAASSMAASAIGCALDEGSVHACLLWGRDVGPWLYSGFVAGWFMLFTLPLMLGTAVAWAVLLVRRLVRRLRRSRRG